MFENWRISATERSRQAVECVQAAYPPYCVEPMSGHHSQSMFRRGRSGCSVETEEECKFWDQRADQPPVVALVGSSSEFNNGMGFLRMLDLEHQASLVVRLRL